jgi:hypothetical protein
MNILLAGFSHEPVGGCQRLEGTQAACQLPAGAMADGDPLRQPTPGLSDINPLSFIRRYW